MSTDREKELAAEVARLKTELEKLRAKNDYTIRRGRDLRTNIASALSYVKLLIRRRESIEPSLLREALDTLHSCLRESLHQVCDVCAARHTDEQ